LVKCAVLGLKGQDEMTDSDSIINRHMARLLCELEEANCPQIFREAVKSKLSWLRKDLNELKGQTNAQSLPPSLVH